MATLHCVTSSNIAEVSDQEAVEALFEEHQVLPVDYRIKDRELSIHGYESFIVQDKNNEYCTRQFLRQLQPYLEDELVIQTVGNEKCRYPLVACQYRVNEDGVFYSDLETDEKELEVDNR